MSFSVCQKGKAREVLHSIEHSNAHGNEQHAAVNVLLRTELKRLHPDQYVEVSASGHHNKQWDGQKYVEGLECQSLQLSLNVPGHIAIFEVPPPCPPQAGGPGTPPCPPQAGGPDAAGWELSPAGSVAVRD